MTEPTLEETEHFWLRIHAVIDWCLRQGSVEHGVEEALRMAELFEDGRWRVMTEIVLDGDQKPVPGSLSYRVDVQSPIHSEWVEFANIKASALGVTPLQAAQEAKWTALQNGHGIPDDLSGLDDLE